MSGGVTVPSVLSGATSDPLASARTMTEHEVMTATGFEMSTRVAQATTEYSRPQRLRLLRPAALMGIGA